MAQGAIQRYNPKTKKYETVYTGVSKSNTKLNPAATGEKKKLTQWVTQFDTIASKPKRTNSDYAAVVRRDSNGQDVTRAILNEALRQGVIDQGAHRQRLTKYNSIVKELSSRPVTVGGKPVTFRDAATNEERTLMRSAFIKDGTYNFDRPIDEVLEQRFKQRNYLEKESANIDKRGDQQKVLDYLGAATRGTYNRKSIPEIARGAYKGVAAQAADIQNFATEMDRQFGMRSIIDTVTGQSPEQILAAREKEDQITKLAQSAVANRFNDTSTPEGIAATVGSGIGGFTGPANALEAGGYIAANTAPQVLGMMATGAAIPKAAAAIGASPKVISALHGIGLIGGQVAETITGNPILNAIGNPLGAMRRASGEMGRQNEENLAMAQEMAPAAQGLMDIAGLTIGMAQFGTKAALSSGNFKKALGLAQNEIKAVQGSASAAKSMFPPAASNVFLTPKYQALNAIAPTAQGLSATAFNVAAGAAAPLTQNAAAAGYLNPVLNLVDRKQTDFQPVDTGHLIGALAGGLYNLAPQRSLMGKFNRYQHELSVGAQARYDANTQLRRLQNNVFKSSPILTHLVENAGLSPDEALAYVSLRHQEETPGAKIKSVADLDNLRESNEIAQGFLPTLNNNVLRQVRETTGKPRVGQGMEYPQPQRVASGENIHVDLMPLSSAGRKMLVNMHEKNQLALLKQEVAPASAVATEAGKRKKAIPFPSMVIQTDEGPKLALYKPDLSGVYMTDDTSSPTTHTLTPESMEVTSAALPRESYMSGIDRFNKEDMARISWTQRLRDRVYEYVVRGFDRGGFIVERSVAGMGDGGPRVTYTASRNEIMRTAPESVRDGITTQLDTVAEAFGVPSMQNEGRGITYSDTSFANVDRSEFPSVVYTGASTTEGAKGTIPARLIHSDRPRIGVPDSGFNTYQLPTGGIIKVPKLSDPNPRSEVLPPTEIRQGTYAGTAYSESPLQQARLAAKPDSEVNFIDINLTGTQGGERKVLINAGDRKKLRGIINDYQRDLAEARQRGDDLDKVDQKYEDIVHEFLAKESRTGTPDETLVDYNYGYTDTPIRPGDVVRFASPVNEKGETSRVSRAAQQGIQRGVVVDVDHHGVHVKIENQLPGIIGEQGGKTVLVHPETLIPEIQPHLGYDQQNITRLASVADLDAPIPNRPAVIEPEAPKTDTEVVDTTPDFDGLAPDHTSQVMLRSATETLRKNATIAGVRDNVTFVAKTRDLTPQLAHDAILNLLNDDYITPEHKERIASAIMTIDIDGADLNTINKINHMIDAVMEWHAGDRPVNIASDAYTAVHFSGRAATRAETNNVNVRSLEIIQGWRSGSRLESRINKHIERLESQGILIDPIQKEAIVKRTKEMSYTITPLRSLLIGNGVVSKEVWSKVSRMSQADQMAMATRLLNANKQNPDGITAASINATLKGFKPEVGRRPTKAMSFDSYDAAAQSFYRELKARAEAKKGEAARTESSNPKVSMTDLRDAISNLKADDPVVIDVFNNLKKQDINEQQFNEFFAGMRFPNSEVTIGDVARHVKQNTLEQFLNTNNQVQAAARRVALQGAQLSGDDWMQILNPLIEKLPSENRENARARATDELSLANTKGPEEVNYTAQNIVKRLVKDVPNADQAIATSVSKAASEVRQRVMAVNPVLRRISDMMATNTDAQERAAIVAEGGVGQVEEGPIQQLQTAFDAIYDLNATAPTKPTSISQDVFDSINEAVKESSTWLNEYGQTTLRNATWKLPLQGMPDSSVLYGQTPSGDVVNLNQQSAYGKNGMTLIFRNALNVDGQSPQMKALVDQMAASLADVYDMHAYGYALRHVDYQMASGNIESANQHIVSLLTEVAKGATPERRAVINELINHVNGNEPLIYQTGNSFKSVITEAFTGIGDVEYGRKLETFVYTHRAAQVQHEFYTTNARVLVSTAKASDFSPASNIATSFASMTAQKNKNRASNRAQVNLLLHLNRQGDEGRDVASLAHEMFHGVFHTLPYADKLDFAINLVTQMHDITGQTNTDVGRTLVKLTAMKQEMNARYSELKEAVRVATGDDLIEAQNNLNDFEYFNMIDMDGDTSNFLYTSPVVNELAATTLMSGAMNTPTIFNSNYDIAESATGVFARVGEFARTAAVMMSQGRYNQADWVVSRDQSKVITGYQHRWQLPFTSFVSTTKKGQTQYATLPLETTISMLNTPSLVMANNKTLFRDIPVLRYADGAKRSDPLQGSNSRVSLEAGRTRIPGASKITSSTSFVVRGNLVELSSIPAELIGKHAAIYNGVKYFKLDSENGIPTNTVNGVVVDKLVIDRAYLTTIGKEANIKSDYFILRGKNITQDAMVTGQAPNWNSNLSSILYNVWGKTSAKASAMVGRVDKVSFDQLKERAVRVLSNVDEMPVKNEDTFDHGMDAYEGTIEYEAGVLSGLNASNKINQYDREAHADVLDWVDATYTPQEQAAVRQSIDDGIDNARRSMFALNADDVRIVPYDDANDAPYTTSRFLVSSDGNVKGAPGMFYSTLDGTARPESEALLASNAALYDYFNNNFDNPNDIADAVGNALLQSQDIKQFESALTKAGIEKKHIPKIKQAILAGSKAGNTKVAYSNDTMFGIVRDFAGSQAPWTSTAVGARVTNFNSSLQLSNLQMMPHVQNQRALIVNAARTYAALKGMPLGKVLQNIGENVHGDEYAGVSSIAHMMALDINSRASAMKTYGDYSIEHVMWPAGSKDPVVILKHGGKANKYSQDLRSEAQIGQDGNLLLAVDQATNTVRFAFKRVNPTTGEATYTLGRNVHNGVAGTEAVANYWKKPNNKRNRSSDTEQLFFGGDEEGNYYKKTDVIFDSTDEQHPYRVSGVGSEEALAPGLKTRLSTIMSNGRKVHSVSVILNAIQGLETRKQYDRPVVVTVPLPHSWGTDPLEPRGSFSRSFKFENFDQVLDAIENDPTGRYHNNLPRHLELTLMPDGKLKISDLGLVGNEPTPIRRTLNDFVFTAAGYNDRKIAPVEVYVARRLLAGEQLLNETSPDSPNVFKDVETPQGKNALSADPGMWNNRSLFSNGYDPMMLADEVQAPMNTGFDANANDVTSDTVEVVPDPSLKPDQVEIDADERGVYQMRGGINMAGVHGFLGFVGNLWNEVSGAARYLQLGGDLGVASNQSWMVVNPLTMVEHLAKPTHRSMGPATAYRALGSMIPNMGGGVADTVRNMGIPLSSWGDNYVHLEMERVLAETPGLTLEMLEDYGLNLEYLKWHKEWKNALINNPDMAKEDVPLNYRLSDYYGDTKVAQRIVPHLAPIERANVFYKDLGSLIDFQRMWMLTQNAVPTGNKRSARGEALPANDSQSILNYRENLRRQYAEATNLLVGNQSGHYSDVKSLALLQKAVSSLFISSRYARSRMLLNPLLGYTIFALKSGANALSSKVLGREVANVKLERSLYGVGPDGWDAGVRRHIVKRVAQAYASSMALKTMTNMPVIIPAMMAAINGIRSGDDEQKEEGIKLLFDNFVYDSGFMKISTPWGKKYQMTMPGATGRSLRQTEHFFKVLFSQDGSSWRDLPDWTFKQFVTNQLAPIIQTARMAQTGKTYGGQDAFASNEAYRMWRQKTIDGLPEGDPRRFFMEITPDELSNFVLNSVSNVTFRDMLQDIETKQHKRLVSGENVELTEEDVALDLFKWAINFAGSGAKEYDESYEEWLNVREGSSSRRKLIKEYEETSEYPNMRETFNGLDFGASIDMLWHGRKQ